MFNLVTISDTVQVYQLIFNPLDYSHIGGYTCQANNTITRSNDEEPFNGRGSDSTTVSVQGKCFSIFIISIIYFCYSTCSTSEDISYYDSSHTWN